jgi:hypothetical protein
MIAPGAGLGKALSKLSRAPRPRPTIEKESVTERKSAWVRHF